MKKGKSTSVMDARQLARSLVRAAEAITRDLENMDDVVIIGTQTRGVHLAHRIAKYIREHTGIEPPVGVLDITLYRDDISSIERQPLIKETDIPFDVTDKRIVLVDDVIYTGRTIRAGIDELMDFGRPRSIKLVALIDRGQRELPIQPDFVGKTISTKSGDEVQVFVEEIDGHDGVIVTRRG
jgi:pyrimidine operon attenuation protein/uracil phosphoribosyltransferase